MCLFDYEKIDPLQGGTLLEHVGTEDEPFCQYVVLVSSRLLCLTIEKIYLV